jgi:hypothetical protein
MVDNTALSEHLFLQLLAADIFSNFLLALFLENWTELEELGKMKRDKALKTIGNFLIENKVCPSELIAKLAIIPALLVLDTKQNVTEPLDQDEIAKKKD